MNKFIGTFFYFGFFPILPGTFASLLAIFLGIVVFNALGFFCFLFLTLILFLIGWWCCNEMILRSDNKDPSEVVVDEVVGQWISLIPIFYFFTDLPMNYSSLPYTEIIIAFFLFRIFDIFKIGPIRWADNLKSGLGIMLDDVLAGCAVFLLMSLYIILI